MNNKLLKDTLGWGAILWFIGYVLGILLFFTVSLSLIGWILTPITILLTLWVLIKKITTNSFGYYLLLGLAWTFIAVVFDYLFLIKALSVAPADYYGFEIYMYYGITFILPLLVGLKRSLTNSR